MLRLSKVQPEFKTPIWDYLGFLVDEQRVADGRAMMRQYDRDPAGGRAALRRRPPCHRGRLGRRDRLRARGGRQLPAPCARHARLRGRPAHEFLARRADRGAEARRARRSRLDELNGSWAGAFGQTQFIPSTYQRLAVDFDGDGRRDLVGSVADALGSTANYLKRAGWQPGDPG